MPWPQQDSQQHQPEQQLISYDSDGGWVRGGIDCGAGVPPTSGNGGDGGVQQRYIGGHGSSDGSGGGNSSGGNGDNGDSGVDTGGGDDGYTLVAGGSDPPPNWVVAEQQDGRNYAEDDSGPTSSTIGGEGRGCNIFVLVLGGNGTKIAPTGDILDQPLGQMR